MRILLIGALLPAVLLMCYTYKMDRIDKEPASLLFKLVFLGALACVPAILLELLLTQILNRLLLQSTIWYYVADAFLVVAVSEEGCKHFFLRKATYRCPEFNCRFDGIVYAVFVSLGFAALENILYVFHFGGGVILTRGLLTVPGHMTFAVFMGLEYSHARLCAAYGNPRGERHFMRLSMIVPVLLHGFYDFCLFINSALLSGLFVLFVIGLDVAAFFTIRKQSKSDRPFPHSYWTPL